MFVPTKVPLAQASLHFGRHREAEAEEGQEEKEGSDIEGGRREGAFLEIYFSVTLSLCSVS